jgi:hypothetical protein
MSSISISWIRWKIIWLVIWEGFCYHSIFYLVIEFVVTAIKHLQDENSIIMWNFIFNFFVFWDRVSLCTGLLALNSMILLPQPPECLDYRCTPACLTFYLFIFVCAGDYTLAYVRQVLYYWANTPSSKKFYFFIAFICTFTYFSWYLIDAKIVWP